MSSQTINKSDEPTTAPSIHVANVVTPERPRPPVPSRTGRQRSDNPSSDTDDNGSRNFNASFGSTDKEKHDFVLQWIKQRNDEADSEEADDGEYEEQFVIHRSSATSISTSRPGENGTTDRTSTTGGKKYSKRKRGCYEEQQPISFQCLVDMHKFCRRKTSHFETMCSEQAYKFYQMKQKVEDEICQQDPDYEF